MSFSAASQELEVLQGEANEIGLDTEKPTKIYIDNKVCTAITKKIVNSQKVKHCAIKLSELHTSKNRMRHFDIEFRPTSGMIADLLTKLLAKVEVETFSKTLRRIKLVIELQKAGVLRYIEVIV